MVTAIVCAYNEEKTVKPILEVLLSHPKIDEVIAVDDGSTDRTGKVIHSIKDQKLVMIHHKKNLGKGAAIATAIKKSKCDNLLLIDADLRKFHPAHVDLLLAPLLVDPKCMTIGIIEPLRPFDKTTAMIMKMFNGERALKKQFILPLLSRIERAGYGIEAILNLHFGGHRYPIYYVPLPGLIHIIKQEKHPFYKYAVDYLQEGKEIVKQYLPPQNKNFEIFLKQLVKKVGI